MWFVNRCPFVNPSVYLPKLWFQISFIFLTLYIEISLSLSLSLYRSKGVVVCCGCVVGPCLFIYMVVSLFCSSVVRTRNTNTVVVNPRYPTFDAD
jgi:hypothetical protein